MKNGGAPHKPILLLAIFKLYEIGLITSNRIEITPDLVSQFNSIWSKLVRSQHNPNFSLPFFHMKTEPFWKLIGKSNEEFPVTKSGSIRSFSALIEFVRYALIEMELSILLMTPEINFQFQDFVLKYYFSIDSKESLQFEKSYLQLISDDMLNESSVAYRSKIDELLKCPDTNKIEEELYVRSAVFKREVPRLYNFQCAVSKLRIICSSNAQMVDACHIIPFSISKDDTIKNGISLSPNLHRAFDRGLISLSDEYRLIVSKSILESKSPYSIGQFEGERITLPEERQYYPDPINIRWHRENCFIP